MEVAMSEDMFSGQSHIVLTTQQIEEWTQEREALRAEIADREARLEQVVNKLRAVELITGKSLIEAAAKKQAGPPQETPGEERENMTEAAVRILQEKGQPMSNKELQSELKNIPEFRERLRLNSNYYYTMMQRLVKRRRVVKEGGKYSAPETTGGVSEHPMLR